MPNEPELVLSCWIVEAARARVLEARGYSEAAGRSNKRAAILQDHCRRSAIGTPEEFVDAHTEWMTEVAGTEEETGVVGWMFLHRLGLYVDAHAAGDLDPAEAKQMEELLAPDAEEVGAALAEQGVPAPLPPEWPEAPEAKVQGELITRFALIGDPHVGAPRGDDILTRVLGHLPGEGADFAVVTGDLTQNGADALFDEARSIIDGSGFPTFVTLGNHDMWGGGIPSAKGLEKFKATFKREALVDDTSFGVRMIVINSADPQASPFPPFDLLGGGFKEAPNESVPGGKFQAEVVEWVEALEPSDDRTFVVLHHPPHPYLGFPPIIFGLDESSTQVLVRMVERVKPLGVFCGHTHRSARTTVGDTPLFEVPCVKEWPFGFGVVEVTDQGWSYNLRQIRDAPTESGGPGEVLFRRYAVGPPEARAAAQTY